jgi:hypothetical protein
VIAKLRDQRVTHAARDESSVRKRALASRVAAEDRSVESLDESLDDSAIDEPTSRRVARMRNNRDASHLEDLGGALELASKANRVKQELQRTPGEGEKSWIKSGVASLALGPIGWLYAGSLREAVPATVAWVALLALVSKILPFLIIPVFMVAMPLSAIAGVSYALTYNRAGKRQRLFSDKAKDKPKQLRGGRSSL